MAIEEDEKEIPQDEELIEETGVLDEKEEAVQDTVNEPDSEE